MDVANPSGAGPHVSVVMPVFNGEHYLAEAIESILAQTFTDFEFIIVNDGSTDGTDAILQRYATREPRIRIIRNTHNLGVVSSLNRGIELARGTFVARQDADDLSMPERFARQVEFLRCHPDHHLVGSQIRVLQNEDTTTRPTRFPLDHDGILEAFTFGCCLGHGSVMFRRTPQIPYSTEAHPAEDYELWIRMIWIGGFANLPDCLYQYRLWSGSISVRRDAAQRATTNRLAAVHRRNLMSHGRTDLLVRSYLRGWLPDGDRRDAESLLMAFRPTSDEQRVIREAAAELLPSFRTNRHRAGTSFAVLRRCVGGAAALRWMTRQVWHKARSPS